MYIRFVKFIYSGSKKDMQDYAKEAEKKTGNTIQQSPVDDMEVSYR